MTNPENNATTKTVEKDTTVETVKEKTIKSTKTKTDELKQESKTSFDIISENTKYNEVLQEVIDWTAFYIDYKLWNDFSKIEKDNIKLVLLSYLTKKINNIDLSIINWVKNWIEGKLKWILDLFKDDTNNNEKIKKFNSFFDTLWINWIKEDLDSKILEVKENKEDKDFSNLHKAFDSIEGITKPEWDILKTIKNNLWNASKKFDKYSEVWKTIKDTAEKLWIWNILQDLIWWLKKEFPFLWSILAMFMWWIESNWSDKKEKSTDNLITFIKNKEKSPLDKIEKNKNLEIKWEDLKDFYKYLDIKWIDYSRKEFWQKFLTWKDKDWNDISDKKIIELRKLIETTDLKTISLDDFTKKLNKVPEISKKLEIEEFEKNKKEKIKELDEEANKATTTEKRKKEIQAEKSKIETTKYKPFEELLKEWLVMIGWKKESIQIIENNKIKIWKQEYSISIVGTWLRSLAGNVFESIKLDWWELKIKANWKTVKYWLEEAVPLLKELINNWEIINKSIEWKPATLTIKEVKEKV